MYVDVRKVKHMAAQVRTALSVELSKPYSLSETHAPAYFGENKNTHLTAVMMHNFPDQQMPYAPLG